MKKFIDLIVVLISAATLVSGFVQMVAPKFVLGFVGAEISPTAAHFFAIVGMFMVLFGALMLHNIYSAETSRVAILWCAFQKLGAFAAVTLGVINGVFSSLAIGVAVFDLFSGILFLYYLKTVNSDEG
jgi:hypothetical protein